MGRRAGSKNLSKELKSKICDLSRAGHTPTYIAQFYKVSRNTVKGIIRCSKLQKIEGVKKKPGRKHKLGPRCIRRLLNYVRDNNRQPLFVIATRFRTKDGVKLSERTIRRYLHKNGVNSYVAASKPYLSTKHITVRLNWCVIRQQWSIQQWSKVAFTDESSFTLRPTKNYARVWRQQGTRYAAKNVVPTFKSGFVSLSVWGLFSARGRSPLVLIDGTLNQFKYIEILSKYVLPFKTEFHPGNNEFLYQHDGCGPHRAKKVSAFLEAKGVEVLPWPAQSPDLNPIEHVWSIMKRRLRQLQKYPTTRDELFKHLCCIWDGLPDTYFSSSVLSMGSRCTAIKNVSGKSSKY